MHTDALAVAHQQLPSTLLGMKKFTSQLFDSVITCPSGRRAGDAVRAASITCSVGPTAGSRCHRIVGPQRPEASNKKKDELNGN